MTFISLCGIAICGVFMIMVLKELKMGHAFFLSLGIGILFFGIVLIHLHDVIEYIHILSDTLPNKTYVTSLLKALGIAYMTVITGEICRSCGENTIAGYVEAIGKAEILIICLPLIRELTVTALKYI